MTSLATFDSTKSGLIDLLSGIRAGKIQLPDFQRGWVWDDPSVYLDRIQKSFGISEGRMSEMLRSHVIEPLLLRADDFEGFFQARERALLERIQSAMGKQVAPDMTLVEEPAPVEYEEEEVA